MSELTDREKSFNSFEKEEVRDTESWYDCNLLKKTFNKAWDLQLSTMSFNSSWKLVINLYHLIPAQFINSALVFGPIP